MPAHGEGNLVAFLRGALPPRGRRENFKGHRSGQWTGDFIPNRQMILTLGNAQGTGLGRPDDLATVALLARGLLDS